MKLYTGSLDFRKMSKVARRAYWIWAAQKGRTGVAYSSREFVGWYLHHSKKRKWTYPDVARKDHSKIYSFDNIFMQEHSENIQERNTRCGNPGKTHRPVVAICLKTGKKKKFKTKQDAAAFHGVSQKTVYNHCQKRTKQFWKYGPTRKGAKVTFQWL